MRVWAVTAWVMAAVFCLAGAPSSATAQGSTQERIEKERQELERLRKDMDLQKRKSREMGRKAGSILSEMEEIDSRLAVREKQRRLASLRYEQKDAELRKIEGEAQRLDATLDRQRQKVGARLRILYKQRKTGVMGWLLTANAPHDLLRRYTYIRRLARADQELFEGFIRTLQALESRRTDLVRARESFRGAKEDAEKAIRSFQEDRTAKDRLLARIRAEKNVREKTVAELAEASRQIQDLIRTLEKQRKASSAPRPPSGAGTLVPGGMSWPSDGKVVAGFGRQKHPQFDFPIFRKGIEIAAGKGGLIHAALGGVVSYADWFRGYGLLVIIDHGENIYSLYGHNAKLFVSVGDQVATGQVIGEVGDTGLSEGNTVYFEIRRGTEALDPLQWLRPR